MDLPLDQRLSQPEGKTLPDTPNSRLQGYRLTPQGVAVLNLPQENQD